MQAMHAPVDGPSQAGDVVSKSMLVVAWILAACLVLASAAAVRAQGSGTVSGSPLDTMMNTRFWTDVPEPKDFVLRARPAPKSLDFRTPYAVDDRRPRPRGKAEVEALTRDLEQASARNRALAGAGTPPPKSGTSR
jgi:hypothetical protein